MPTQPPNEHPFFQFPLCLFSFGPDVETRLRGIVNWCCLDRGTHQLGIMDPTEVDKVIAWKTQNKELPAGFNANTQYHRAIILGMRLLNVTGGHIKDFIDRVDQCHKHIDAQTTKHGKFPNVRIEHNYLWEVVNRNGMTARDFFIVAAVHCLIGESKCARLTRDRIRAAALGYKRARDLFDEDSKTTEAGKVLLAERKDKSIPLTQDQVRYTLDQLEARKFFARVSVGRSAYFSNKTPVDDLRKLVFKRRTHEAFIIGGNRTADQKLAQQIEEANRQNSPQSPRFYSGKEEK